MEERSKWGSVSWVAPLYIWDDSWLLVGVKTEQNSCPCLWARVSHKHEPQGVKSCVCELCVVSTTEVHAGKTRVEALSVGPVSLSARDQAEIQSAIVRAVFHSQ